MINDKMDMIYDRQGVMLAELQRNYFYWHDRGCLVDLFRGVK